MVTPPHVPQLDDYEKLVLDSYKYKSHYMRKNRYQMMLADAPYEPAWRDRIFPTLPQWQAAQKRLVERGYLTRGLALTPKGREKGAEDLGAPAASAGVAASRD